jgi:uncharacterized protein (TIGR02452 family)
MKRSQHKYWAQETVAICEAGCYVSAKGRPVTLGEQIARAKAGTKLYAADNAPPLAATLGETKTRMEVANETAFAALQRHSTGHGLIGCLNFASARNAGGGFLNGAQAQEEALCRASALYPCLLMAPDYYDRNRANRSAIYLDLVIYSPQVPFFRSDSGILIDEPILASVITAPAPNAGAVAQNEPHNLRLVEPALRQRAEQVLRIARAHQIETLVLGAWGCGVFRNDPALVAKVFADLLFTPQRFANVFSKVVFAVYDRSETQSTYEAFREVYAQQNVEG